MNEDIHRVRQDLDLITSAAGFGQPPLGAEDVWTFRLLGASGLAWTAFTLLMGGLSFQSFTLFGLVVSLLGVAAYHFKYTPSKARTITRDRVYFTSWRLGAVLGVLIGGFYIWAKFYAGLAGATFLGATFLFSGALLVILAITDRWRLFFMGWAVPMLCFGASVQFMSDSTLVAMLGLVVGLGGFSSAVILNRQLRPASQ